MAEESDSDNNKRKHEISSSDSDTDNAIIGVTSDNELDLSYESEAEPVSEDECEVKATLHSDWIEISVTIEPRRAPPVAEPTASCTPYSQAAEQPSTDQSQATESSWTTNRLLSDNIRFVSKSKGKASHDWKMFRKPENYFNFFFSDNLVSLICKSTNREAKKLGLGLDWKPLTRYELRKFIAMLFHMGTVVLDDIKDYWNTDRILLIYNFEKQMVQSRFIQILECLSFNDKVDEDDDDPLHRVKKLIKYFNKTMKVNYNPSRDIMLEEGMIVHQGRLRVSQYVKDKKGIRLCSLTEPDGMTLKLHVHAGRADPSGSGEPLSEQLALHLLEERILAGHSVYMDSWYSSFELSKKLLCNNTHSTGILRINCKGNPKEVVHKSLIRGHNISMYKDRVHIGKYNHKGEYVTYITTEFDEVPVPVLGSRGQTYLKPRALVELHKFGSVADRQELIMSYYPCKNLPMRWDLKVAIHVFQLMLVNSFLIYSKYSGLPKINFHEYRVSIINMLIPTEVKAPKFCSPLVPAALHEINKYSEKSEKGKTKRRHCKQCYKSKKRKDTVWFCATCPDKPCLCVTCFKPYHMEMLQ